MTIEVKQKAATKKQTELQVALARIAELEAQVAKKPSSGRTHNGELLVSEADVSKMGSSHLFDAASTLVARDASGKKITKISKKGNPYNTMAEGAEYGWYNLLNSFAGQVARGNSLSEKQVVVVRGILSDMIRGEFLEIK
jgi:hypothetical protein